MTDDWRTGSPSARDVLIRLGLIKPDATPEAEPAAQQRCEACGQKLRKQNPHRMCKSKWAVLHGMASIQAKGHQWVKVTEGSTLSYGEGSCVLTAYRVGQHAARLKWFGLVDHKGPRTAMYRANEKGILFLAGKLLVPEAIWCRDGVVERVSDELVSVSQVHGVVLDKAYWDSYGAYQVEAPFPAQAGDGQAATDNELRRTS